MSDEHGSRSGSELERIARASGAPVEERLDDSLLSYWVDRFAQHAEDNYAGVPLFKFPEDLRVYEHLLWADRPNVVIEIGTHCGGSALWFRDRLRVMESYGLISDSRVITIDIDADRARPYLDHADRTWSEHIYLISDDVRSDSLLDRVARSLPSTARCFVVEDSAHTYATTMAALTAFAPFVSPGGFFVVEDGCVDIKQMRVETMRLGNRVWAPFDASVGRMASLPAVSAWLASPAGQSFVAPRPRAVRDHLSPVRRASTMDWSSVGSRSSLLAQRCRRAGALARVTVRTP